MKPGDKTRPGAEIEALRARVAELEQILDSIQAIVWRGDPRTFQFTYVSGEAEALLGYPCERWTTEPTFWADHIHPEDREWAVSFCAKATAERRTHEFEYRMIAADGRVVWLRDIVRVVVEDDQVRELIGVMVDVTERRRVEEEAERKRRQAGGLSWLSRAVTTSLELPEVLDRVARVATDLLPNSASRIWVVEGNRLVLRSEAGILGPPKSGRKTEFAIGEGITGHVALTRRPLVVEDLLADPRLVNKEWTRQEGYVSFVGIPLFVRDRLVGVIVLLTRHRHSFSPEEMETLVAFGTQAAIALENARLYAEMRERLQETATLLAVGRVLSLNLPAQEALRRVSREVARAFAADMVGAYFLDSRREALVPLAGYHVPKAHIETFVNTPFPLSRFPFFHEIWKTRKPAWTSDYASDDRFDQQFLADLRPGSLLFAPTLVRGEVVGGLFLVWWAPGRRFSAGEVRLIEGIASQVGLALESQRKFEELSVLYELSHAVTGQFEISRLVQAVHEQVGRVLDARNMLLLLYDEESREFEVALAMLEGGQDPGATGWYPFGHGLFSRVVERRQAIRTSNFLEVCEEEGVQPLPTSVPLPYWLGVPMIAGDRVLGVVVLRSAARSFTAADERLLTNIADLAALAVRSARLYEERTRAYGELAAAQDQLVRTEKLRALGEMASGVAHNFNNLLTPILARAQILLQGIDDPKLRKALQMIERAAQDGARTIRRIQEFTRIRRDRAFEAVDLNEVVQEALEVTQPRWQEEFQSRGAVIQVVTSLAPLPSVAGDPAELREALVNLILNAVDAMPDGGTLSLTTGVKEGRAVVTVSDTGTGMSEEVQRRLFDPFFTTKGPRGTGLGLSMTYGVISRHGGEVAVESAEGKGSTFRLSFPTSGAVPATPQPAPSPAAVRLRCLVVDDEPSVREVLGDMLEVGGHTAVLLRSGAEAVERLKTDPFDLVITDLAMPGLNGWEVARAVKEHDPAVPVFLVTGWGVEYPPEELKARGVDRVLPKPLNLADVLAAVSTCPSRRGGPEGC